ncbi:MAG: hypothetical protein WD426_16645 [Anditalea sp.]
MNGLGQEVLALAVSCVFIFLTNNGFATFDLEFILFCAFEQPAQNNILMLNLKIK